MTAHIITIQQLAQIKKPAIQEIDASHLYEKCQNPSPFLLIDVRETEEWQGGHIENAIHLSRGTIESKLPSLAPHSETEIVVYCSGGVRSALVAYNLQEMGYKRVYSLKNGLQGWLNAGYVI